MNIFNNIDSANVTQKRVRRLPWELGRGSPDVLFLERAKLRYLDTGAISLTPIKICSKFTYLPMLLRSNTCMV